MSNLTDNTIKDIKDPGDLCLELWKVMIRIDKEIIDEETIKDTFHMLRYFSGDHMALLNGIANGKIFQEMYK